MTDNTKHPFEIPGIVMLSFRLSRNTARITLAALEAYAAAYKQANLDLPTEDERADAANDYMRVKSVIRSFHQQAKEQGVDPI